jgi:hypothetical protein
MSAAWFILKIQHGCLLIWIIMLSDWMKFKTKMLKEFLAKLN